MTTQEQLEDCLKDIPSKWREQLISLLSQIKKDIQLTDCNTVKDCETLTTLSNFSISGSTVCISYTGEDSIVVTRCFELSEIIGSSINITAGCLTDDVTWDNLTLSQKIQMLIDSHCDCCSDTTSTTSSTSTSSTSTTSTSSSTTTTTTSGTTTTSTSTTSTSTSSTTSTTSTSSSTTTTTTAPYAQVLNTVTGASISSAQVSGLDFITITDGSVFPLAAGEDVIGTYTPFTGQIAVVITGSFAASTLKLYKNTVEQECIPVTTGGTYTFGSQTFITGDIIWVRLFIGTC